jgi:hypothetical protein
MSMRFAAAGFSGICLARYGIVRILSRGDEATGATHDAYLIFTESERMLLRVNPSIDFVT